VSTEAAGHRIRLLIVDDNVAVRQALAARLSRVPEFELLGDMGGTEEALARVQTYQPDIVLFGSKHQRGFGLQFCQHVLRLEDHPEIIVLTSFEDDTERLATESLGVRYVLKEIASPKLIEAIRAAYAERRAGAG
jgi:DNA-binding NarL/FixJ family response regulator